MTLGGWLTMILSVGTVVTLFVFCLTKVLMEPNPSEHMKGLDDIDTQDLKDPNGTNSGK